MPYGKRFRPEKKKPFRGEIVFLPECLGSDAMAKKYMNRLGDYLYVLARSMEAEETELPEEKPVLKPQKETEMTEKNNALIEEILRRVNDNR